MKIHTEYEQGSVEWMLARSGIPTASEFDQLLTPDFKARTGQMPKTYLNKKLGEAWQGGPLASFNTFAMDQGQIMETEAIPWFELQFEQAVDRVAFCTTDDGRIGCSPDGLITTPAGLEGGIEVKCPEIQTHVGYLLDGVLPKDYATQVHGAMFVTGRKWWQFLSYRRHFPPLLVRVERDEEIIEKIEEATTLFLNAFDAAFQRLCDINGGPPVRKKSTPIIETASTFVSDPNDIIP